MIVSANLAAMDVMAEGSEPVHCLLLGAVA